MRIALALFTSILAAGTASAAQLATGVITQTGTTGSDFNYSVTLTDSGSDSIGTFWYSWIPGQDYMASSPVAPVASPAGWSAIITHGGASDGYAIQWIADSVASEISPGGELTFSFVSPDDFAAITGTSPYYAGAPVGTSFVYSGGPFSGSSDRFIVSAPEPGCISLLAFSAMGILNRRLRREPRQ